MNSTQVEYIVLFTFCSLVVGAIVVESRWLTERGVMSKGRATAFAIVTNLIGFGAGLFLTFAFGMILLMVLAGPEGTGLRGQTSEATYLSLLTAAAISPLIVLVLAKRISLVAFIPLSDSGGWKLACVSALLVFLSVMLPPVALIYFFASLR